MTSGILVFHIIVAALMIGIILIQRNEGGGLGMSSNSMSGIMTTRGAANLLTRVTAFLAVTFFVTTIVLALLFKGAHKTKSLLDVEDVVPVAVKESKLDTAAPLPLTDNIPPSAGTLPTPTLEKPMTSSQSKPAR